MSKRDTVCAVKSAWGRRSLADPCHITVRTVRTRRSDRLHYFDNILKNTIAFGYQYWMVFLPEIEPTLIRRQRSWVTGEMEASPVIWMRVFPEHLPLCLA